MSKSDFKIYNTKTGKYSNPKDEKKKDTETDFKRKAKRAALENIKYDKADNVILKSMADDVNRAETEEEALKKEERYNKYKEMFKRRKGE